MKFKFKGHKANLPFSRCHHLYYGYLFILIVGIFMAINTIIIIIIIMSISFAPVGQFG